jgi:hypothetical protein
LFSKAIRIYWPLRRWRAERYEIGLGRFMSADGALPCPPVSSSYWPLVGTFMSTSGQFFMSADRRGTAAEVAAAARRWLCDSRAGAVSPSTGA